MKKVTQVPVDNGEEKMSDSNLNSELCAGEKKNRDDNISREEET